MNMWMGGCVCTFWNIARQIQPGITKLGAAEMVFVPLLCALLCSQACEIDGWDLAVKRNVEYMIYGDSEAHRTASQYS